MGSVNLSITRSFAMSVSQTLSFLSAPARTGRSSVHLSTAFDPRGSAVTTPHDRRDSRRESDPPLHPPTPHPRTVSKQGYGPVFIKRRETVELIYGSSAKFNRAPATSVMIFNGSSGHRHVSRIEQITKGLWKIQQMDDLTLHHLGHKRTASQYYRIWLY